MSARGGLEPRFRVLFSAVFHGVRSEISIRVENHGFWRKQNCCKLLPVYVHFINVLYRIEIARPFEQAKQSTLYYFCVTSSFLAFLRTPLKFKQGRCVAKAKDS
jgi:hypothetical protein